MSPALVIADCLANGIDIANPAEFWQHVPVSEADRLRRLLPKAPFDYRDRWECWHCIQARRKQQRADQALALALEAAKRHPGDRCVLNSSAGAMRAARRPALAHTALTWSLRIEPDLKRNGAAYNIYAACLCDHGKYAESLHVAEAVIAVTSGGYWQREKCMCAHRVAARACRRLGQDEAAGSHAAAAEAIHEQIRGRHAR